jgi:galactonate dehydratase
MKITAIKSFPIEGNLIVKVETDEGIYGVGEAGMAPPIPATMKVLDYYAEWLIGRDPDDIEGIWQELFRYTRRKEGIVLISAISGIDMALWDIKGKALGVPVWRLLGGKARERTMLYAHVQGPTIEATCENAQSAVDAGFKMVRFQLDDPEGENGFDQSRAIRYSVRLSEEVRRTVGDSIELSIDIHQRLSPARAVDFCQAVHPVGLLFVEDPTRTEDPSVYRQLRQRVPTPLATGENLYSKWQFRPLIEEELTDYLRIDLALVGGLTEARKVAAMGEAHYLDVVPHCARGPLLEQVSLHFSIATTNVAYQEHTGGPDWWNDILPGLSDYSGGSATPPEGPGLGVEFNEEEAKKHPFVLREMPRWRKVDGSVQDW